MRRFTTARSYGLALASVALICLVKWLGGDALSRDAPFRLMLSAVIVSGWLGGGTAALLATLLSVASGWLLFVTDPASAIPRVIAFTLEGLILSLTFAAMHNARRKLLDADQHKAALLLDNAASARRLEALGELAASLSVALTYEEVARVVVEQGMRALGADTCTLYRREDSAATLELIGEHGVAPGVLERIRHITPESNSPPWLVLGTGETIWAETEQEYRSFYPELASMKVEGPRARAFFCAPLLVEHRPCGLLGMGFYAERSFPAEERLFVETFCRHCAQALLRAERLGRETEARAHAEQVQTLLATTLRSIGDGVLVTDREGRITFMNAVAVELTGWREDDAAGRPITEVFRIVNEQTRATVENPVARVLKEGVVVGLANHTVLLGKHGRELPIDDSGAPIRNEAGEVRGAVLVFRDVSAKKLDEERRAFFADATTTLSSSLDYRVTLSRLAQLAVPRSADWCAIEILEDGSPVQVAVAHVDPAKLEFARALGREYPPDRNAEVGVPNVIRSGKSEFYPELSHELLKSRARDARHLQLIEQLQLRSAMVVPLRTREQVLGAMTFVYAESGRNYTQSDLEFAEELARRASIAIENARLYTAEQSARQSADVANRAKDEFLATVSHELRTPLNAILGWAKLLTSAGLDESKRARAAETIERNAVAMAQLIEDLLDVSRIISGKMRLETRLVDLGAVVNAALESAKPSIDAKGITLTTELDPHAGAVVGDPSRLQQVIWNLLSNAVKFSERGGQLELRMHRGEGNVELSVRDTGKGISAQFLPHVFDPFRQADGRITRSHGGLGLGLSICRHIIELHGGQISAHSEGEGKGSTFVVRLPVRAAQHVSDGDRQAQAPPKEEAFERPPVLRGLKVLVVDDDEDARHLVERILEECGSRVACAASVPQAMAAIGAGPPDVLVSDIGMPGEDGFDLIRKVRALPAPQGGQVPAVALTAYTRAQDRRQLLNAGFMMHVPKPVEPAELVSVVASLARWQR